MDRSKIKLFKINLLQWNAQSIRPKLTCLEDLLCREKIHIAMISETWLDSMTMLTVSGYNIYRHDRDDGYGGVAIMTHKSIQSHQSILKLRNSGIEVVHVKLLNCPDLHDIVSVYCPSSINTTSADWEELFAKFCSKSLVAGDFNGHHKSWCSRTDSRGTQLWDAALEYGLTFLNDGAATRVKMVDGLLQQSSPDISFTSSDISFKFDWNVANENLGSDHLLVKIRLNYLDSPHYVRKRNLKLAKWNKYTHILTDSFSKIIFNQDSSPSSIQDMYDLLVKEINKAADHSIPCYKICNNPCSTFVSKPYWGPNLSLLVAQRRLALKDFRRNPIPGNLSRFETKVEECLREFKKAKSESWHEFCDTIDEEMTPSDLWGKMRWMKGYKRKKAHFSDEKQIELLKSLTPDLVTLDKPMFTSPKSPLEIAFTIQELESCLKKETLHQATTQ
ncbi:hypothetical protein O0L34_g4231 [Tuta absoluta]|nr:hypothetical protein O0L34_g4231 [Tuta absoluta]